MKDGWQVGRQIEDVHFLVLTVIGAQQPIVKLQEWRLTEFLMN